jgi:hypothetical protein
MGGPGWGRGAAAVCDTFGAPSTNRGRAGELDVQKWSAGRMEPKTPTADGFSLGIGKATLPPCRPGLPPQVFPDNDALICNASADIASNHLLVAVAAQNYGQNSYRIRQPFDFAGRTGKIVFDAEGFMGNRLWGWISVAVTPDPTAVPSFAVGNMGVMNDEGAVVPRAGIDVEFQDDCAGMLPPPVIGVRMVNVFQDYKDTQIAPMPRTCTPTKQGRLNHFEIDLSQTKIDVYATPFSADGKTYGPPKLLFSSAINLPFSRGYVTMSVHNHATLKYTNEMTDAWIARWDNVGFDGPVVSNTREYEAPDSLHPSGNPAGTELDVGYRVADIAKGPSATLHLPGVNLDGAAAARLAFSMWYPAERDSRPHTFAEYVLKYRFNGGTWRDRPLTPSEIANLNSTNNQGAVTQTADVMLSDLHAGDNTLEFVSVNMGQGYPPLVANIDLVLTTK